MGQLIYADDIHAVEQAKVDAARMTQKSGNARSASDAALANFNASLANKRRLDAAGSAVNDSATNSVRIQQQLTRGRLSDRIRAAEELGAAAAMAGAAGVGGASVDTYNETVRLTNSMKAQAVERSFDQQEWASGQQRGNAVKAAVAGLDNNAYRANMDYTQYLDHKKPSFLERAVGIASIAAATVFGGPQAGAAMAGVFETRQAARNGDFGNASASLTGAVQNGLGAMRTAHLTKAPEGGINVKGIDVQAEIARTAPQAPDTSFNFNQERPDWGSILLK